MLYLLMQNSYQIILNIFVAGIDFIISIYGITLHGPALEKHSYSIILNRSRLSFFAEMI